MNPWEQDWSQPASESAPWEDNWEAPQEQERPGFFAQVGSQLLSQDATQLAEAYANEINDLRSYDTLPWYKRAKYPSDPAEREARVSELLPELERWSANVAQYQSERPAPTPEQQRIAQAPTLGAALGEAAANPGAALGLIGPSAAASLVQAPQIAAAGLAGGPRAAALMGGYQAASDDYYGSLLSQLGDMGYDVSDNEILTQALQQADALTQAQEAAKRRAIVVGGAAGLGTALGGKMLAGAVAPGVGREVANVAAQVPLQAGVDMAGEALAQQASGEGYKPGEVVLEGLGGAVTAPVDVAQAAAGGFKEQGAPAAAPQDVATRNAYIASLTEADDGEGGRVLVDAQGTPVGASLDEAKAAVAAMSPQDIAARMAAAPAPGELGVEAAPTQNPPNVSALPEGYFEAQAQPPLPPLEEPGAAQHESPGAGVIDEAELAGAGIDTAALGEVAPPEPYVTPGERAISEDEMADAQATPPLEPLQRPEPRQEAQPAISDAELAGAGVDTAALGEVAPPTDEVKQGAPRIAGVPRPTNVQDATFDVVGDPAEIRALYETKGGVRIKNGLRFPRKLLSEFEDRANSIADTSAISTAQLGEVAPLEQPLNTAGQNAAPANDVPAAASAQPITAATETPNAPSTSPLLRGKARAAAAQTSETQSEQARTEPAPAVAAGRPGSAARVSDDGARAEGAEALGGGADIGRVPGDGRGARGDAGSVEAGPAAPATVASGREPDAALVSKAPGKGVAQTEDVAPLSLLQQRIADAKDSAFVPDGGNVTASVIAASGESVAPGAYEDGRLTGYTADAVEAMARLFGKKVVVFRETGKRKRDGFVSPKSPGTIFLNADATRPHVAVFMHELLHSLKRTDAKTYAKLEKALAPLLKDHARFKDVRMKGKGSDALVQEEMMADVMGDQASDPKFWADLYDRFGDKSAWAQFVSYMRQMLSNVIDVLYPLGSYEYVTDFNKAYEAVVDAAYNHARAQHGDEVLSSIANEVLDLPVLANAVGAGSPPSQSVLDEGNAAWRAGAVMWDNMNRMRIAQDKLVERGLKLRDDMNVWVRENLARSKMRVMADKVTDDFQTPILKAMKKADLSLKQVDDFLYAKHATERNREIAKINPKFPDGGSGMTNAEAARVLASFTPEQTRALSGIAKLVYDMQAFKLDVMEKNGLTEPAEVARLKALYSNYVPLKTIEDDDVSSAPGGTGRGIEVSRSEYRQALGRGSRASSPLMVSFQDMARVLVRAHKNEAGNALLALARDPITATMLDVKSGKPIIGIADPADYARPVTDAQGNVSIAVPSNWWQNEEVFITKEGGVQRYIAVRDPELMSQLRRMGDADIGKVLNGIGGATRLFARMLTQYNPVFAPVNLIRDSIQASILSLGVPGINPAKVIATIPLNLARIMGHKLKPSQRYTEFLEDGASTNAYGLRDLDDALAEVEAVGIDLGYAPPRPLGPMQKGWRATRKLGRRAANAKLGAGLVSARNVFQALAWWNEGFENAVRLSTYNAMRDAGVSREQAAFQSKELSTNFNKKGEWSSAMNAAYVFVNAAMQGNRALLKFAKQPPVAAAIVGLVAAGVLQDMLGAALGGEDDESGLKNIDEVGDWALDHNIILITGPDTQRKIPLPYGLNLPFVIGRRVSKAIRTGDGFTQLTGILNVMLDNFSPIGGVEPVVDSKTGKTNVSATIIKTATPSLARPLMSVATNSNFMGAPIARTPFQGDQTPAPRAYDAKPGTADYAIELAKALNHMSGGDKAKPGDINISPEHVEFLVGEYGGGAGRFVSDSVSIGTKLATGKAPDIEWTKAPFIRSFSGVDSRSDAYARFRQISTDAKYTKDQQKAGEPVRPLDRGMLPVVEQADKRLKALRDERKAAYAREDMKRVRAIQDQEQAVIKNVVKIYETRRK